MKSIKYLPVFCLIFFLLAFASNLNSQTIYVCESNITDGEPKGEITRLKIDLMKENFVYILVKFPSSIGCNEIKFKRHLEGNPNPVMPMDTDPSATWVCFEMYIPDKGEYTFTVFDCNDVELGKTNLSVGLK